MAEAFVAQKSCSRKRDFESSQLTIAAQGLVVYKGTVKRQFAEAHPLL